MKEDQNIPTDFELKVLLELSGEPQVGMMWGAAMTIALEWLKGNGYVSFHGHSYDLTRKGRDFLEKRKEELKK